MPHKLYSYIDENGEKHLYTREELSKYGKGKVDPLTIWQRINKMGWTPQKAADTCIISLDRRAKMRWHRDKRRKEVLEDRAESLSAYLVRPMKEWGEIYKQQKKDSI